MHSLTSPFLTHTLTHTHTHPHTHTHTHTHTHAHTHTHLHTHTCTHTHKSIKDRSVKQLHSSAHAHSTWVETELFRVCEMGFSLKDNPPCLMLFLGDCGIRGGPSCPICIPMFCKLARRFFGFCCNRGTENALLLNTGRQETSNFLAQSLFGTRQQKTT